MFQEGVELKKVTAIRSNCMFTGPLLVRQKLNEGIDHKKYIVNPDTIIIKKSLKNEPVEGYLFSWVLMRWMYAALIRSFLL